MTTRVFGPVQGAGTQIRERSGDKPIEPGALGYRGYAGLLEKGPPRTLLWLGSPELAKRRVGEFIADSLCPDAIYDSFNTAAGAGGVLAVRVTDGNEVQAQMVLYARRAGVLTPMGIIKAHNGGRWGGKAKRYSADLALIGDLTNITLDTKDTTSFKTDEYKGGYIQLSGGLNPAKKYPIVGNTSAGVFTVAADQTMLDDLNAGTPADLRYYIARENEGKAVAVELRDGDENPDTDFGVFVYVDGELILQKPNLSTDPESSFYWVNVINNDTSNYEIEAVDLWTGAHTADIRPANVYGLIDTVTATVLTAIIHDFSINSPSGGDPTFALGTTVDEMVKQKITLTMTSPTAFDAVSDVFGPLGSGTLGALFDPPNAAGGALKNKWVPSFTVTAGATPLVATDTLVVNYKPFVADALIGGYLYPDKVNAKRERYRIVDNNHKSITVPDGSDLTTSGAPADEFMVVAMQELEGGRDGNADVGDAEYIQAWDPNTSPFNRIVDRGMGMVKYGTPGVYATAVQKAGVAYASARNHQYRIEVDPAITTDPEADEYVNETIGRSPYMAVAFPSYAYVPDPQAVGGSNKLKLTSRTGEIHGREARIAVDNQGYHKAEAGTDAVLPSIVKLTTEDRPLDEELLNPRGLQVIKVKQGNYVIWGDRLPSSDPEWKWKHQREQLSYYEHVLQENYDWIIFAIHNPEMRQRGLQSLRDYFRKEYRKGALDNDYPFEEAARIKLDRELNTDDVKAAGDMLAAVSLKLVDTVERFIIIISKQGIFESVG